MFPKKVNPAIGPGSCGKSTSCHGTLKDFLIILVLMTPLNVKFERLLLGKLLAAGVTFMRKIASVLLEMVMHGILLILGNYFSTMRANIISICIPLIFKNHTV
jgi:hypothetical protein